MKLADAFVAMLRSRRFWTWQLFGAFVYMIPVLIRYGTGSNDIPILNFPGIWVDHFIPGNLLEKALVNAFFPGGAGAIAGEVFLTYRREETLLGRTKYLARLGGALTQTALWSLFQYWGYSLMISGPGGGWNLFEHPVVFPINFVLASLSIFTPTVVYFIGRGIVRTRVGTPTNTLDAKCKVNIFSKPEWFACHSTFSAKTEKSPMPKR